MWEEARARVCMRACARLPSPHSAGKPAVPPSRGPPGLVFPVPSEPGWLWGQGEPGTASRVLAEAALIQPGGRARVCPHGPPLLDTSPGLHEDSTHTSGHVGLAPHMRATHVADTRSQAHITPRTPVSHRGAEQPTTQNRTMEPCKPLHAKTGQSKGRGSI